MPGADGDALRAQRRARGWDVPEMARRLRRSTLLIDMARAQHMRRDTAAAGETLIEAERVAPLEVCYSGAARGLLYELLSAERPAAGLRDMAARVNMAA